MSDHPAVQRCKARCRKICNDDYTGAQAAIGVVGQVDALAAALAQEDAALRERHRRLLRAVESYADARFDDCAQPNPARRPWLAVCHAATDCHAAGDAAPAAPATKADAPERRLYKGDVYETTDEPADRPGDVVARCVNAPRVKWSLPRADWLALPLACPPAAPPAPPPADPLAGITPPKGAKLVLIDWRNGDGLAGGKLLAAWPSRRDWQGFAYPPTAAHPKGYVCGATVLYRDSSGMYSLVCHDDMAPVRPVGVAVDVTV